MNQLKPQTLRGFNDWFASDIKLRQFVINTFSETFEKYGYEPLETPALEYSEFMIGISGSEAEKQFYRFKDQGGRDVMLKYEVMTAMCRAVAANVEKIKFPYKRYQIQPVWRAENTQKGRYRQFTQCDADTIGSPSMIVDAEFIQMGLEVLKKLGFKNYVCQISNRKFLDGLREYLNIPKEQFYGMCMSIDKLKKIGQDKVVAELVDNRGLSPQNANTILKMINPKSSENINNNQIIDSFSATIGSTIIGKEALSELRQIFDYLEIAQVSPLLYRFDTSLARGLASYTGPVWEFEVTDGNIGSVAGCGRYDNVIGRYLNSKTPIPATGGSFGIERLCDIIKDQGLFSVPPTSIKAMVTIFSPELTNESIKLANYLRDKNIPVMLYPDPDKLAKQFKYASEKSIPYVLVLGPDEINTDSVTVKNMSSGVQTTVKKDKLIESII